MSGRYDPLVRRLRESVLEREGATSAAVRRAVEARAAELGGRPGVGAAGETVPEPARFLVDRVARHAHRVTDADVEALRAAGYTEDAIFDIVAAAALGAGLGRLERGMAVLRGRS